MKTYIKPEVQELICKNDLCDVITMSANSAKSTGNNWSREEEMDWDEEQGW